MNSLFWEQQYETERAHLLESLGKVTEGGIVETIQHIGATRVPGLKGSSCVDVALAVWPFPLEVTPKSKLESMGYRFLESDSGRSQQRFCHKTGSFQLFFVESGSEDWLNLVLVNDYLCQNERTTAEISTKKASITDKSVLFAGLLPEAQKWWVQQNGFSPGEAVATELKDAPFEWYVSGGWALDLFLENVERVHQDVDLVIPRQSQLNLQNYLTERNWKLFTPFEKHLQPWPPYMRL